MVSSSRAEFSSSPDDVDGLAAHLEIGEQEMILLTAVVSSARLPTVSRELEKVGLAPTMVASVEAAGLSRRSLMHRRTRYATNAAVRIELLVSPAEARRAASVITEAHDASAGEQVRLWASEVSNPLRPIVRQLQEPAASTP